VSSFNENATVLILDEDIELYRSEENERLRSLTASVISPLIAEILFVNLSNTLCDVFEW